MNETINFFSARWREYTDQKEYWEHYSARLSNGRLVFFLLAALLTVLAFLYAKTVYGYLSLGSSVAIFVGLIRYHDLIIGKADYYRKMAEINQQCRQRLEGEWTRFADDGREYHDPRHPYTGDLDIFGQASLFQWINTTNTYHGREYLQRLLAAPEKDTESIQKRQQAIRELAARLDFCQELQCRGMGSGDYLKNPEKLFSYAENRTTFFRHKWPMFALRSLSVVTLLTFMIAYITPAFSWYIPGILVILQILINVGGAKKANLILATIYAYKNKISVYQRLLEPLENQKFDNGYLKTLQAAMFNSSIPASQQIKKLDTIFGAVAFKYNAIVHFLLNNLFFWDYQCVWALEKWKAKSGSFLRDWVANIGSFEALCSLAMVSQLNPEWGYPEFDQDKVFVRAEEMGHPLLNDKLRVRNNLQLDNQIGVITGSNMSGKTTLLRTVGVNLVLAYAGAPVCARRFQCSLLKIFTSMRVSDDLNQGISTFYAELLRIKMIMDFAKTGSAMIFLIDEVFRGTNSLDRLVGARNVLLNLNQSWIIGLISTHDYELCALENNPNGRITNYHFIESYRDDEIHFDYQLKAGPCNTTNARYLMKMAGIDLIE